jgi:DNA-binding NarL/FixJ family response regulator
MEHGGVYVQAGKKQTKVGTGCQESNPVEAGWRQSQGYRKKPEGLSTDHIAATQTDYAGLGLERAREKGVRLGPPLKIFNRQQSIDLRKQGHSIRQIARQLNIPTMTIQGVVSKI